jgi:hypothetical protein
MVIDSDSPLIWMELLPLQLLIATIPLPCDDRSDIERTYYVKRYNRKNRSYTVF